MEASSIALDADIAAGVKAFPAVSETGLAIQGVARPPRSVVNAGKTDVSIARKATCRTWRLTINHSVMKTPCLQHYS